MHVRPAGDDAPGTIHDHKKDRSLQENRTYTLGLIFHLYKVFCPPVQMSLFLLSEPPTGTNVLLTEARHGLIQLTRYKRLTFALVGGSARTNVMSSHLYQVKTPTSIN
jgi:hypothetical protein